ncbi:hypothetical protein VOLCADRAFT_99413 [Volvox carteri f. nagariensis]|uniref:Uncharacterized protein n=1 Tax=Volvox carteri f. nagariensis TaxID=3068 RepID=D8UHR0_VOLCA|nr:uncharacterized protein VOLCADRAFT_99413 [Volvox carteri f. nagariensis]EFJ40722.1 hypothetical protein VOLCADRAFT_99413 [Volvox carteri f. nagariensis]|eukprot:XP_002958188.1 hypothetical protein VOLCADRAFT_99413 [Volvox carteri f. nagariensis]
MTPTAVEPSNAALSQHLNFVVDASFTGQQPLGEAIAVPKHSLEVTLSGPTSTSRYSICSIRLRDSGRGSTAAALQHPAQSNPNLPNATWEHAAYCAFIGHISCDYAIMLGWRLVAVAAVAAVAKRSTVKLFRKGVQPKPKSGSALLAVSHMIAVCRVQRDDLLL